MPKKVGLELDRVVLLGRTLEEYTRFFALDLEPWRGQKILDVAAGVSSFTAEARTLRYEVTGFDRIYSLHPDEIQAKCERDLDEVARDIGVKPVYRWDFYKTPAGMRAYRERAYQTFLRDIRAHAEHYVAGELPRTSFEDNQFNLTLASYLLFVYEDQLTYEFHKQTLQELMRITANEIRVYPLVTFEAEPSGYLERLRGEPSFRDWRFEIISTDFEFLRNSNCYLKIAPGRAS